MYSSYVGGPLSLYRLSFGAASVAHSRVKLVLDRKSNFVYIQNKQTRKCTVLGLASRARTQERLGLGISDKKIIPRKTE